MVHFQTQKCPVSKTDTKVVTPWNSVRMIVVYSEILSEMAFKTQYSSHSFSFGILIRLIRTDKKTAYLRAIIHADKMSYEGKVVTVFKCLIRRVVV